MFYIGYECIKNRNENLNLLDRNRYPFKTISRITSMNKHVRKLQTKLGNKFSSAYKGTISLMRLYAWGEAIGYSLACDIDGGRLNESDDGVSFLQFITGVTHELHDGGAREHFWDNPDELNDYAQMLLGTKSPVFA
jgi:hypothetical protein